MRASLNPERRERHSTIGSVKNILNGRYQVMSTSLTLKRCQNGSSSPGPQRFWPFFLRFLAILSIMMVVLVSGTRKK